MRLARGPRPAPSGAAGPPRPTAEQRDGLGDGSAALGRRLDALEERSGRAAERGLEGLVESECQRAASVLRAELFRALETASAEAGVASADGRREYARLSRWLEEHRAAVVRHNETLEAFMAATRRSLAAFAQAQHATLAELRGEAEADRQQLAQQLAALHERHARLEQQVASVLHEHARARVASAHEAIAAAPGSAAASQPLVEAAVAAAAQAAAQAQEASRTAAAAREQVGALAARLDATQAGLERAEARGAWLQARLDATQAGLPAQASATSTTGEQRETSSAQQRAAGEERLCALEERVWALESGELAARLDRRTLGVRLAEQGGRTHRIEGGACSGGADLLRFGAGVGPLW